MIRAWHASSGRAFTWPSSRCAGTLANVRHAVLAWPRLPRPRPEEQHGAETRPRAARVLHDRRDDVLRFTTDTSVWPTNNISERGVRPLKTQQKISGRLTSDDITQDRLDIRSYIDTARKHGTNAMDVLHDLMLGRPWRPPAPHSPITIIRKPATHHQA